MSIEEYRLLMRRAAMFLDEAREAYSRDRYDLVVFLAEQALQLFLKAQLLRMLGDYPRTHSVRQLLAMLGRALGKDAEKEITVFIRRERPRLSELEDVYIVSRYGFRTYTRDDAEDILSTVERVMSFVEELLRRIARDNAGEG